LDKQIDWEKKLSPAAKAEMLAATFHLLTDHSPKVWKKVPAWLRAQIRQAMFDCAMDAKDLTKRDTADCVEYGEWLNLKHPQPRRKPRRRRNAFGKLDNSPEMRDFLYNKESSGR
jgi:hypothetical protein